MQNSVQNNSANEDPMEKLSKLKKMLDAGLIEQSEYDAKKAEILSAILRLIQEKENDNVKDV